METTETLDGDDNEPHKVDGIEIVPDLNTHEEEVNNQNSHYDFESKLKAAKQDVNDYYDYEMNIDDGEEIQSEAEWINIFSLYWHLIKHG